MRRKKHGFQKDSSSLRNLCWKVNFNWVCSMFEFVVDASQNTSSRQYTGHQDLKEEDFWTKKTAEKGEIEIINCHHAHFITSFGSRGDVCSTFPWQGHVHNGWMTHGISLLSSWSFNLCGYKFILCRSHSDVSMWIQFPGKMFIT